MRPKDEMVLWEKKICVTTHGKQNQAHDWLWGCLTMAVTFSALNEIGRMRLWQATNQWNTAQSIFIFFVKDVGLYVTCWMCSIVKSTYWLPYFTIYVSKTILSPPDTLTYIIHLYGLPEEVSKGTGGLYLMYQKPWIADSMKSKTHLTQCLVQ